MFIEVHVIKMMDESFTVSINVSKITGFYDGYISLGSNDSCYVTESYDEIKHKIRAAMKEINS